MDNKSIGQKISFDRAMNGKKAIVVCGGLLVLIFILGASLGYGFGPVAISNVIAFLFLLTSLIWYDHDSWRFNLFVLVSYLALTVAEYLSFGLPALLISPEKGIHYGSLMEVLIISLPYFYIGLRFMMVIPLLILLMITRDFDGRQKSRPSDR